MKPMIWIITVFTLAVSSPASGNYDQMKEELNTYQPPAVFFVPKAVPLAVAAKTDGHAGRIAGPEALASFKSGFEAALTHLGQDLVDPATYDRIHGLAGDESALIRLLEHRVRLEEIKAAALLRNPEIRSAKEKVAATIQSFDQVMNLDDQLRQYSAFTTAGNNRVGPLKAKDSIKMAFPSPGLTALKGRVVKNSALQRLEKAAVSAKTVIKDVEAVFRDLQFISQSIRITHDTIAAFERLKDVATVLYRSGKTSFQDVIKVNIKLEELKEALVTLASKEKTRSVRLFELLDLPGSGTGKLEPAPLPDELPAEKGLYTQARTHRQELAALRFQIEKVASMVEMAETMGQAGTSLEFSFNDKDLFNTTGTGASKEAFATQTMAAMKNNSPARAWYSINQPWLEQTRKTLASLKSRLEAQENATDRMVRRAWFKADKNHREHLLYQKKILPLAKSALDVTTREYEAGSIPFSQAIGSYTDWLTVQLTIARKHSNYGISFAELEYIIGKPLR